MAKGNLPKKVTAQTVRYATRAGLGRTKAEPVAETWAQRQERVDAERAARRAQREAGDS